MKKWILGVSQIDEGVVRKPAIKIKGGSVPSTMDAGGWKRILRSNNFGITNVDLSKFRQKNLQRISVVSLVKHLLPKNSPLLTKIQIFDQRRLDNYFRESQEKLVCQNSSKTLFQQLGHVKYVQGKKLDLKQLYMLWKIFSKRNQQKQLYWFIPQMTSALLTVKCFLIVSLFYHLEKKIRFMERRRTDIQV